MWRIGWAPNSIPICIQQDAKLYNLFISGNCSTCFGFYFHPSSGAHTSVSTASGICHTVTAICRYRGKVGTCLSVLWMVYATHSSRDIALLFHDHGTRRGWGVSVTPRPLYTPGKTRYPLYRRLGGPQGRTGQVWKISPPPGFDSRTVQPVASRYTDWATGPTKHEDPKLLLFGK
jgi:hypothetical protein